MTEVKYPNIKVRLVGKDGNAFAILGNVRNEMRKHKVPAEEIKKFMTEAMSGDYNNLLRVCMSYVNVE